MYSNFTCKKNEVSYNDQGDDEQILTVLLSIT